MFRKRKKDKGFTLIELLATIAILAIVSGFAIYVAVTLIGNSKKNSYLITINNIEDKAVDYLNENSDKLFFEEYDDDIEYRCITVDELVDMGYFKPNIIDSKVSDDKYVKLDDYIYVARNVKSKTVVKEKYLFEFDEELHLCNKTIEAEGNVLISVTPDGYSKYKDVTIKYTLKNYYNVGDYSYEFKYEENDNSCKNVNCSVVEKYSLISDDGDVKKIRVHDNGKITGYIKGINASESVVINNIDITGPNITIETNGNNYVKTINSKISVDDIGIGADENTYKYIYSNKISAVPNIKFNNGNSYSLSNKTGIYYLIVEACDKLGNCSKKISDKLYIDNTKPVIQINNDLVKVYGVSFDLMEGVTITDNVDKNVSSSVYLGNNKITSYKDLKLGDNVVTYKAIDVAGNEVSKTRKITIVLPDKEFNYKEADQVYEVMANGTYIVEAYGGQGGNGGGAGGYVKAEVSLKAGDKLIVNTGGVNGYNGGGGYKVSGYNPGGGASTIRYNGSYIVIAGGGVE